jgi:putative transposase
LVQARFARPLALPDEPAPAASLDRIRDWLAEATQPASANAASGVSGASGATPLLALHAWAILPDAITLLATPGNARILSDIMQAMGRRLGSGMLRARVYNGRYHNALLEPGRWVLPAMLWVETLAVVNGYVGHATQWPWSSAAEHSGLAGGAGPGVHEARGLADGWAGGSAGGKPTHAGPPGGSPVMTDHADYWHVGDTPFSRQAAWRQRLTAGIAETHRAQIEAALHGQWALGEKIFLAHLGRLASRRVTPAPRGRPRKGDKRRRSGPPGQKEQHEQ